MYEAIIVPTVCVTQRRAQRVQLIAPMSAIPSEIWCVLGKQESQFDSVVKQEDHTTGLNKPPLIRKNVHAKTTKLKPAESAMKSSCWGVFCAVAVETSLP